MNNNEGPPYLPLNAFDLSQPTSLATSFNNNNIMFHPSATNTAQKERSTASIMNDLLAKKQQQQQQQLSARMMDAYSSDMAQYMQTLLDPFSQQQQQQLGVVTPALSAISTFSPAPSTMDDSELFFGDAPSTGTDPLENWFPSPKEFENCAPANSLDRLLGGRVSGETHLFDSLHTNNNNNTNNTNTPNPFPSYLDAAANFNAFGPFPSVSRNNMNVTHPQQQEQHSSGSNRAQSIIPPLPDFATSLDFASTTPSLPHLSVQERIELIQILQRTIAANAAAANLQTFSDAPLFPTSYEPSPVNFFGTPAVQAPVHTAAPMSNPSKVAAARLPEPPTVTLSAIEPAPSPAVKAVPMFSPNPFKRLRESEDEEEEEDGHEADGESSLFDSEAEEDDEEEEITADKLFGGRNVRPRLDKGEDKVETTASMFPSMQTMRVFPTSLLEASTVPFFKAISPAVESSAESIPTPSMFSAVESFSPVTTTAPIIVQPPTPPPPTRRSTRPVASRARRASVVSASSYSSASEYEDSDPSDTPAPSSFHLSEQRRHHHHASTSTTRDQDGSYRCTCGNVYKTLGGMRAHAKLHGIGRPFGCESCGKTFQRKQDLKRHEFTHEGMKPYVCGCGVAFSRSDALQRHKKSQGCE